MGLWGWEWGGLRGVVLSAGEMRPSGVQEDSEWENVTGCVFFSFSFFPPFSMSNFDLTEFYFSFS